MILQSTTYEEIRMECIDVLKGKEFSSAGGLPVKLKITSKAVLALFVSDLMIGVDLPIRFTHEEIAEMLNLERKSTGKTIRELLHDKLLVARKEKHLGKGPFHWAYYGHEAMIIDGKEYPSNIVDVPTVDHNFSVGASKNYYVYVCKHKNVPIYVGKGHGNRINHCLSGSSSCQGLNKLVLTGEKENMTVSKMYEGLTSEEALAKEREVILGFISLGYNLENVT